MKGSEQWFAIVRVLGVFFFKNYVFDFTYDYLQINYTYDYKRVDYNQSLPPTHQRVGSTTGMWARDADASRTLGEFFFTFFFTILITSYGSIQPHQH